MKYRVDVNEKSYGFVEVEAASQKDAIAKAYEAEADGDAIWNNSDVEIIDVSCSRHAEHFCEGCEVMPDKTKDLDFGIGDHDFVDTFGRRPTRAEFDEFVRLCRNGLGEHIDWNMVFNCAKEAMKANPVEPVEMVM